MNKHETSKHLEDRAKKRKVMNRVSDGFESETE